MEKDPSLYNSKMQRLRRPLWQRFLLNAAMVMCFSVVFFGWRPYDKQHSEQSSVIATVDHWRQNLSKGNYLGYSIDVTLPDGSKVVADAAPIGPAPPQNGERIELIKTVSTLGFTSYSWERPILTWEDAVRSTTREQR